MLLSSYFILISTSTYLWSQPFPQGFLNTFGYIVFGANIFFFDWAEKCTSHQCSAQWGPVPAHIKESAKKFDLSWLMSKVCALVTFNSILLRSGLYPPFGCQQDFLVVWRWNQLRRFLGIFENNFTDFREAVSLEKIFEIVQENTLKCSKLIHF